jgi:UDP-N-acetylglucosamine--N-acetylmuramyl-(pentapeptide) pyrophosphoryl-undecaprenol N-acetylglucosamine transferase
VATAGRIEQDHGANVFFVASSRRIDRNILGDTHYRAFYLTVNPMPHSFGVKKILVFITRLVADIIRSFLILIKIRPDAVAGFGGYSSGAIVCAARICGLPVLLHEQNLLPGRANRLLCRIADTVAVSFGKSEKFFSRHKCNVVFTGNPLREEICRKKDKVKARESLGLHPDKFTFLIMGGSQGSTFLNRTVTEGAGMLKKCKADEFQIIHLTGRKDHEKVAEFYRMNGVNARVFSFLGDIETAYSACDTAVSRAGAAAIFELAFYGKAMILVPYPNPKNNQRSNAEYFAARRAAVTLEEKNITPEGMADIMLRSMSDAGFREGLAANAGAESLPEAAADLAGLIKNAAQRGGEN